MMRFVFAVAGWAVAAVFAVFAVAHSMRDGGAEAAPPPAGEARRLAPPPVAEQPQDDATDDPEDEAAEGEMPVGDDWSPPGETESIGGIYAFLGDAAPEHRALASRIADASRDGDCAAVIAAARDAMQCADPRVRAMALAALGEMRNPDAAQESARLDMLLGFAEDENGWVSDSAAEKFGKTLLGVRDFDVACAASLKAIAMLDAGSGAHLTTLLSYCRNSIPESLGMTLDGIDPDRIEKAMRTISGFAASGSPTGLEVAKKAFESMEWDVDSSPESAEQMLNDQDLFERKVAQMRETLDGARNLFPDSETAQREYIRGSEFVRKHVQEFYKDDPATAEKRLSEYMIILEHRIRANPDSPWF